MIPLSLNGNMDNFEWPSQGKHFTRKIPQITPYYGTAHEKGTLMHQISKKDTLISDLLRSEPHPEKGTLFWEFLDTHVNKYHECGPPGIAGLVHVNDLDLTTQILVSPCHSRLVYAINKFGFPCKIYRNGLTYKYQNLGRKVAVKYMNEPCNAC